MNDDSTLSIPFEIIDKDFFENVSPHCDMKYFSKVLKAAAGHFRISEAPLSLYIASFGNDHVSHQNDRT